MKWNEMDIERLMDKYVLNTWQREMYPGRLYIDAVMM